MHNKTNNKIIYKRKPVYSAIMQIFLSVKYPICVGQSCVIFLSDIFFSIQKQESQNNLDPSCETDLEFWDRFGRDKTLSNNRRNMVIGH